MPLRRAAGARPGRPAILALTCALALLLSACQLPPQLREFKLTPLGATVPASTGSQAPIRIGATLTLSGTGRHTGSGLRDGYYLWARQLNAAGGLAGRPVDLVIYDDEGKPERAAMLYEKLIHDDGVDLLLGPSGAKTSAAAAAVAARRQRPVIMLEAVDPPAPPAPAANAGGAGNAANAGGAGDAAEAPAAPLPWAFSLRRPGIWYGGAGLELARQQGYRTLAMVFDHDEPEATMAGLVAGRARQLGFNIIHQRTYPADGSGLGELLTEVRSGDPDVLLLVLRPVAARTLVRRAREAGFTPRLFALVAGTPLPDLAAELGQSANGLVTEVAWHPGAAGADTAAFVAAYRELFREEPGDAAAAGYALGQVLQHAAAAAGLEPAAVQGALAAGRVETLLGPWQPDAAGHNAAPAGSGLVVQYQKQKPVVVYPAAAAAAEPALPFAWDAGK